MKMIACIEYDGTNYCGWQRLSHAPSIQNEVEKALSKVANHKVEVTCAGRTDSGVHGLGQIIHFETGAERTTKAWLLGTNSNLPDDIAIVWVSPGHDDFHARFSALQRRYRYIILNRKARPALLQNRVCWSYQRLDHEAMHRAAQALLGEQDFSSFRAAGCQASHAIREVKEITVSKAGEFVYIDIAANAFLHHMVRNIAGSLIMVGRGDWTPEFISDLLAMRDRTKGGPTAPAAGLYFVHVDYPLKFGLPGEYTLPSF